MTRFCALLLPGAADLAAELRQMGGEMVYHSPPGERLCALATLPDQQAWVGAGPYRVPPVAPPAHLPPEQAAELVAVGQVRLFNRAELLAMVAPARQQSPATLDRCDDGTLLLHLYACLGLEGLARVRGMVACAIWDNGTLLLLRDPIGERTLYYSQQGPAWAASSSLHALRRWPRLAARLHLPAVQSYLTFAYLPGAETLLADVFEVLPGQCIRVAPDGSSEAMTYHHLREPAAILADPPENADYSRHLRGLLDTAVQSRLPPNQPVAVFLSGGVDSSLVTALAARLHDHPVTAYAINFGAHYRNELAYAHLVAAHCGTGYRELTFSGEQVLGHFASTMARLDNPVGDPLTIPNLLLAQTAAAEGFQVILNGEGGDPCFGGPKNLPMLLFELHRTDPDPLARARAYLRSHRNCYTDLPALLTPQVQAALQHSAPSNYLESLVLPSLHAETMNYYVNRLMLTNTRLKGAHHILSKVEKLTASCGLEGRSPLFDRAVVDYAFAIPPRFKLHGTSEKWMLKQAVADTLPPIILYRPKSGMQTPLQPWLRGPLGTMVEDVLLSPQAQQRGIFQPATLREWLRDDPRRGPRHANKLWLILSLELWLRAYLDQQPAPVQPPRRRWWNLSPLWDHPRHPRGRPVQP